MKKSKEKTVVDDDFLDVHKRTNEDYKKLHISDKRLINQIDLCLEKLSAKVGNIGQLIMGEIC